MKLNILPFASYLTVWIFRLNLLLRQTNVSYLVIDRVEMWTNFEGHSDGGIKSGVSHLSRSTVF